MNFDVRLINQHNDNHLGYDSNQKRYESTWLGLEHNKIDKIKFKTEKPEKWCKKQPTDLSTVSTE